MCYEEASQIARLQKLYDDKCGQAEKASSAPHSLRYQVLKAEADAIRAELEANLLVTAD